MTVENHVLKVELHSHTSDDPQDLIPHDTFELIDRAAALGFHAIAVTLHDAQLDLRPFAPYARERGVTLIPGIERTIAGRHVLLINFTAAGSEAVRSFDDLRRLRASEPGGLVVAPHPFFPATNCLHGLLVQHQELFDAVEYNGMFTGAMNFNGRAERFAASAGLPMVGNGDVHRLEQLGTTYSLVDAAPEPEAICAAMREGRVRVEARPHTVVEAVGILGSMFASDVRRAALSLRYRLRPQF